MFVVSVSRKSPCQALDFLRIMLRVGMQPTQVVHGVVIGACIKSQQLKEGWHHPWKVSVKFPLCKAIHNKPWRYTFGKWVILTMNMCWFHEGVDPLKFMKKWGINYFTSNDPHHGIHTFSYWQIFWHSIWHIFCHSIWHTFWHIFWHIFWHSIWQIFWHSIWHIFWHSI